MYTPSDPAVSRLFSSRDVNKETCIGMFIMTAFIVVSLWSEERGLEKYIMSTQRILILSVKVSASELYILQGSISQI